MFEFTTDLPIVVSVGTLITLIGTIINYTSKVSSFKKQLEMKCQEVDERLNKIESLELGAILARIQADVEWLKNEWMKNSK